MLQQTETDPEDALRHPNMSTDGIESCFYRRTIEKAGYPVQNGVEFRRTARNVKLFLVRSFAYEKEIVRTKSVNSKHADSARTERVCPLVSRFALD